MDKPRKNSATHLDLGKLPPQAIDLEEAVLGACMLEKSAFGEIADHLHGDMFYTDAHQAIYKAMVALSGQGGPIDSLTVVQSLKKAGTLDGVGGPYAIAKLTERMASAAHIQFHAKIIKQKWIARELIRLSGEVQREAFEDTSDCYEIMDGLLSQLNVLYQEEVQVKSFSERLDETIKTLEETDRSTGISGLRTGFESIDRLTHGLQKSDLIVLAARPGMGKTTLALQMMLNTAALGNAVDFYSLEMNDRQLIYKLVSTESGFDLNHLRHNDLNHYHWKQINESFGNLRDLPIHIDDRPALHVNTICRAISAGIRKRKTKLVIIDYLQLINGQTEKGGLNRDNELGAITRKLKATAKELDIPIIALCQLSRATETRGGNKVPMLSDLRESGNIEQDCDIVGFIYRPEYYGITEDADGTLPQGITQIIIDKHRNGKTDKCLLQFRGDISRFEDYRPENPFE